jgi:hypothetical protein
MCVSTSLDFPVVPDGKFAGFLEIRIMQSHINRKWNYYYTCTAFFFVSL